MGKWFVKFALGITWFLSVFLYGYINAAEAEPLLVMQPAYGNMQFYVHQPYGIPTNWYTTFDGYPVWKGADGVWFYGSYVGSGLTQTSYIVGSVVPTAVGIYPYVAQTVAVASAPAVAVASAPAIAIAPTPALAVAPGVTYSTAVVTHSYVPKWTLMQNFMALGAWRGNVDRVGMLVKPSIPIAWKGQSPSVLYAWTGAQWYQITAGEGDRPGDVLKNNLYALTRLTNQNGNYHWTAPDVAFLINQSAYWGYIWMGAVGPNPQSIY